MCNIEIEGDDFILKMGGDYGNGYGFFGKGGLAQVWMVVQDFEWFRARSSNVLLHSIRRIACGADCFIYYFLAQCFSLAPTEGHFQVGY